MLHKPLKTTYLLAWTDDCEGPRHVFFEVSTMRLCLSQGVVKAGLRLGDERVVAFCDYIHGDDYLTKDELRTVAKCWLDTNFKVHEVNLRY